MNVRYNVRFIIIIAFLFFVTCCMLHVRYVFADNMESSTYRIQMGTINIGGKDQTSDSYKLGTSLGQTAANEFSSSGYIVKAGFQYIHSIIPFRFSLSSTNINLGTLSPNTPLNCHNYTDGLLWRRRTIYSDYKRRRSFTDTKRQR